MTAERGATAICVLGMHRSGTSCLTGLLENAGAFLGEVSRRDPYNARGNHENRAIMNLHEAVLAANGGAWDHPPEHPLRWSAEQQAELDGILAGYRDSACWAFKDPRSLFTLPAWLERLPDMRCIGTFRHPSAVAQSLYRRGGVPAARAWDLWLRYNLKLLDHQARYGFDMICFDLPPAGYLTAAARAFRRLGLDVPDNGLVFFDASLRNLDIDAMFAGPPAEVLALYQRLRERAL